MKEGEGPAEAPAEDAKAEKAEPRDVPPPPKEEEPEPAPPEAAEASPDEPEDVPAKEKKPSGKKEAKAKRKAAKKRPSYPLKLFERWDLGEVTVHDKGLERYINLSPIVIPHTGGRHGSRPFGKSRTSIVERLINNVMRNERYTGKKSKAIKVVEQAFEIIEAQAKKNPVQVLVEALENAAPREEITRLRFGGISVPRAVDIGPSRRLDLALRNVCEGAVGGAFKGGAAKKAAEREKGYEPISQYLAQEILAAARGDVSSSAIAKKDELERVAASAR